MSRKLGVGHVVPYKELRARAAIRAAPLHLAEAERERERELQISAAVAAAAEYLAQKIRLGVRRLDVGIARRRRRWRF